VIEVEYNSSLASFDDLLEFFWINHDPHAEKACSRQYKSVIFYGDENERLSAERSLAAQEMKTGRKIPTDILPLTNFFIAKDYHQKYLLQRHGWLMEELELEPGEQIIESIVAARLNGYINGYGDKENLLSEKEELGLTSKVVNYVIRKMEEKREKA